MCFLWEGRTVGYEGSKVIVLEKINKRLVKVAKAHNTRMILFVKREELYPWWARNVLWWLTCR